MGLFGFGEKRKKRKEKEKREKFEKTDLAAGDKTLEKARVALEKKRKEAEALGIIVNSPENLEDAQQRLENDLGRTIPTNADIAKETDQGASKARVVPGRPEVLPIEKNGDTPREGEEVPEIEAVVEMKKKQIQAVRQVVNSLPEGQEKKEAVEELQRVESMMSSLNKESLTSVLDGVVESLPTAEESPELIREQIEKQLIDDGDADLVLAHGEELNLRAGSPDEILRELEAKNNSTPQNTENVSDQSKDAALREQMLKKLGDPDAMPDTQEDPDVALRAQMDKELGGADAIPQASGLADKAWEQMQTSPEGDSTPLDAISLQDLDFGPADEALVEEDAMLEKAQMKAQENQIQKPDTSLDPTTPVLEASEPAPESTASSDTSMQTLNTEEPFTQDKPFDFKAASVARGISDELRRDETPGTSSLATERLATNQGEASQLSDAPWESGLPKGAQMSTPDQPEVHSESFPDAKTVDLSSQVAQTLEERLNPTPATEKVPEPITPLVEPTLAPEDSVAPEPAPKKKGLLAKGLGLGALTAKVAYEGGKRLLGIQSFWTAAEYKNLKKVAGQESDVLESLIAERQNHLYGDRIIEGETSAFKTKLNELRAYSDTLDRNTPEGKAKRALIAQALWKHRERKEFLRNEIYRTMAQPAREKKVELAKEAVDTALVAGGVAAAVVTGGFSLAVAQKARLGIKSTMNVGADVLTGKNVFNGLKETWSHIRSGSALQRVAAVANVVRNTSLLLDFGITIPGKVEEIIAEYENNLAGASDSAGQSQQQPEVKPEPAAAAAPAEAPTESKPLHVVAQEGAVISDALSGEAVANAAESTVAAAESAPTINFEQVLAEAHAEVTPNMGGIELMKNLRADLWNQLGILPGDLLPAGTPASVAQLLEYATPAQAAQAFGFYDPLSTEESFVLHPGDSMSFNAEGDLIFTHQGEAQTLLDMSSVIAEDVDLHKAEGEMKDYYSALQTPDYSSIPTQIIDAEPVIDSEYSTQNYNDNTVVEQTAAYTEPAVTPTVPAVEQTVVSPDESMAEAADRVNDDFNQQLPDLIKNTPSIFETFNISEQMRAAAIYIDHFKGTVADFDTQFLPKEYFGEVTKIVDSAPNSLVFNIGDHYFSIHQTVDDTTGRPALRLSDQTEVLNNVESNQGPVVMNTFFGDNPKTMWFAALDGVARQARLVLDK